MKDMHGGSTINVDVKLATTTTATASTPAPTNDTGEEGRQDKVKKQHKKSADHSGTTLFRAGVNTGPEIARISYNFHATPMSPVRATCACPRLQVTAVRHAGVAAAADAASAAAPPPPLAFSTLRSSVGEKRRRRPRTMVKRRSRRSRRRCRQRAPPFFTHSHTHCHRSHFQYLHSATK